VLGICPEAQSYEGEAAMRLEAIASRSPDMGVGFDFAAAGPEIDPSPMWHDLRKLLAKGASASRIAWFFHAGLAVAFANKARELVENGEAQAVALSGGCFQNPLLHSLTPVLVHRTTPANDGGLALGQAVIAAARALTGAESL
jgi:hydrogenase maturation protein HypF